MVRITRGDGPDGRQTDRPDRSRGTDSGRDGRVTARAADARRADQPGRDERAQRPLLHDQGSGAAADPPRPLRLLHARTTSRGSSWSRSCRATASRSPRSRSTSPTSRATPPPSDIALQRAMLAPWQHEAPIEMSRSELDKRAGRKLADDDLVTLAALGVVLRNKRGRYQVAVSQLSIGLGPARPRLPDRGGAGRRRRVRRARPADRPGALRRVPDQGVAGLQGVRGVARAGARGRRAAQAAVDLQPGRRPTSPPWTRPSARASPSAPAEPGHFSGHSSGWVSGRVGWSVG